MKIQYFIVCFSLILFSLIATYPTRAVTVTDGGIGVDCNGATFAGSIMYTRDNTGMGQETVQFISFDGAGNQMSFGQLTGTVGTSMPISGTFLDSAPQFNPLTLQIISIAGNSLTEQIAFSTNGTCAGLPTISPPVDSESLTAGPPATNLFDGRINNNQRLDVAAPIAIYCDEDAIEIYKIDAETAAGSRVIYYPLDRDMMLPVRGDNITLSQLANGDYQANAYYAQDSKPYIITWTDCDSGTLQHLAF